MVPYWVLQKHYKVHVFFSIGTSSWHKKGCLSLLLKVMWKYHHHTPLLLVTEVEKSVLYIREKGQGPVRRMFANSTEQERWQLMRQAYKQLPWPHHSTTTRHSNCHRSRQFTVCFQYSPKKCFEDKNIKPCKI